MARTNWVDREQGAPRLVRILWDKEHHTPWAIYYGTITQTRQFAKELRKALGRKSQRGGYPMVEIDPYPVPPEQLSIWAWRYGDRQEMG